MNVRRQGQNLKSISFTKNHDDFSAASSRREMIFCHTQFDGRYFSTQYNADMVYLENVRENISNSTSEFFPNKLSL